MTSERLLNMNIKVLYLPKNFYTEPTSPKQISGYAPGCSIHYNPELALTLILARELSLWPYVCDAEVLWSYRLGQFENNYMYS